MATAFYVLLPLVLAFVASALFTPGVRALSKRMDLYADPSQDRWDRSPVAMLGGVAIVAAWLVGVASSTSLRPLFPLLGCASLMFSFGLADDLWNLRPTTKLVGQSAVSAMLIFLAPAVHLTAWPPLDLLLSLLWIVGITNAFNLLDNINGLAAGVAAIAGAFYLVVLSSTGADSLIVATAAFVGAACGFLLYNFGAASIFMGDSGSFFLGFFLAAVSLLAAPSLKAEVVAVAAIPLLILLIPIFDVLFVVLTRGLAGRSAFVGGRDHTSHRLVALGIGEHRAVLVLYALAGVGGAIAISVQHLSFDWAPILIGLYVLVLAGLGVMLGHVDATRPPTESAAPGATKPPLLSDLTSRYRIYEVLLDVGLIALAYYAAFRLRFLDEPRFTRFLPPFMRSLPLVVAWQLASVALAGKYRQLWHSFGSAELLTILRGIGLAVAGSVILVVYLYRFEGFSRGVFLINIATLAFLLVGARVAMASVDNYLRRRRADGKQVLIYGAGRGGALLARELLEEARLGRVPIGFIDDDRRKRRVSVEGLPVLGDVDHLAEVLRRNEVREVILSIQHLADDRLAQIAEVCRIAGVPLRRLHFAVEDLAEWQLLVRNGARDLRPR